MEAIRAAAPPVGPRDAGPERSPAAARAEWGWRWRRWTRWPFSGAAVLVATVAVVIDVGTAWAGVSMGTLGRVPVSPALPLGLLVAAMIGRRRLGLDRANRRAWAEFLAVGGVVLVVAVVAYAVDTGRGDEVLGLVLAAFGEELVYRLAVIVVVGAACAWLLGRNWRNASEWGVGPGVVAVLTGSLVFSLLPGHIAQMSDTLHALPFASLGLVLGYAVLRTGALIPATIVHALLNLATVTAISGDVPPAWRNAFAAVALCALVVGTVVAGLRLGILRREPTVIDLGHGDRDDAARSAPE